MMMAVGLLRRQYDRPLKQQLCFLS